MSQHLLSIVTIDISIVTIDDGDIILLILKSIIY